MKQLGLRLLLKNAAWVLVHQGLIVPLHFGTTLLIARHLGANGVGVFTMATLLPILLVRIAELGVPAANVFFLARRDYSVKEVAKANLFLGLLLGGFGLAALVAFVSLARGLLFSEFPMTLLLLGAASVPMSLLRIYCSSIFHGLQDFRTYNLLVVLPYALMFIGTLITMCWLCPEIWAVLLSFFCSHALSAAVCLWCLRRQLSDPSTTGSGTYIRRCLGYGWKAHMSTILAFLNYRLDMFLVAFYVGSFAVGLYGIAVAAAEGIWLLSQALSAVVFPRSAELKSNESLRTQLTTIVSRWVFVTSALAAAALACACGWFLPFVFGETFRGSVFAFRLLLPGVVIGSMSRVLSNDIAARGHPEVNMYIGFLTLLVNAVCNCLLIPLLGIEGAAIATSIAYCVNATAKTVAYSRLAGVKWHVPLAPTRSDISRMVGFARGLILGGQRS